MKQKLVFLYFLSVILYSCDKHNINGHWHIVEVAEDEDEDVLFTDEMPSEFYDFYTFDIRDHKGTVNRSSAFLRQYEISQDKQNKELIIHTDLKPITLKYAVAPWIVDNENLSDTDTLYLFSKETNTRYRGYRDHDTTDVNHIYDPFNIRNYKYLKIPAISNTLNLKTEDQNIISSDLIIFPNGLGELSSLMFITNRIASNDSAEDAKRNIQSVIKDVESKKIKVFIDGRYKKDEVKELLQTLLSIGAKGVYIPIKKTNQENIHWVEASVLLDFIIQSENDHPNLKIWDAVDIQ